MRVRRTNKRMWISGLQRFYGCKHTEIKEWILE